MDVLLFLIVSYLFALCALGLMMFLFRV